MTFVAIKHHSMGFSPVVQERISIIHSTRNGLGWQLEAWTKPAVQFLQPRRCETEARARLGCDSREPSFLGLRIKEPGPTGFSCWFHLGAMLVSMFLSHSQVVWCGFPPLGADLEHLRAVERGDPEPGRGEGLPDHVRQRPGASARGVLGGSGGSGGVRGRGEGGEGVSFF